MPKTVQALIEGGRSVVAPGVGDPLSARLAAAEGFECLYMSGFYVSACLGFPDVGLVTLSEMVNQAARICASVPIPVIADGDTGHGNVINVIRTVREFERAGVAAIHIEDQVLPKRCGDPDLAAHTELIPVAEMCAKIRAACDARTSSDFMIMARSDSLTSLGMEEALDRARAYREAGAEAIMLHGPREAADLPLMRAGVEGPLAITVGGWKFPMTVDMLEKEGFELILYPLAGLRRSVVALKDCFRELKTGGAIDHDAPTMMSMPDLQREMGMSDSIATEQKYARVAAQFSKRATSS